MQAPRESKESTQPPKPGAQGTAKAKDDEFPLALAHRAERQSGGTVGRQILINVNYFSLQLGKLERAVHYDVTIDPDRPKKELRRVMEAFRMKHYPTRYPAFDGTKNLYSSSELPFGEQLRDENVTIQVDERDKTYKVTVKFAAYVDLGSLRNYFSARAMNGDHLIAPQDAIQCIDIVLRSAPALSCISAGRSFFTKPPQILELGDGMEMYYGFYQSAILCWKPFLNVDVAHKAFPISQPVISLIKELYRLDDRDLANSQGDWRTLESYLRTLKIRYEIPGQPTSRKLYRVNGLGRSPKEEQFAVEGRAPTSVFEYFRAEKRYNLRYPTLPCLWVGNRERRPRVLLPAELCTVVEGQDVKRKMNEIQTSKMIRYAATSTDVRKQKIMESVRQAQYNSNPSIREFGFSVASEFEKVNARILPPPDLLYSAQQTVTPSKGVWAATNNRFIDGAVINRWTIGCLDRRTRDDALGRLASMVSI